MRAPDFENMRKVLARQVPARPVLFELFMNNTLYARLTQQEKPADPKAELAWKIQAFQIAGYDYTTVHASAFHFSNHKRASARTLSLNDGAGITDWAAFEAYEWDDPQSYDVEGALGHLDGILPEGMKLMVMGPGGVIENAIELMGYENLCVLLYEEPDLVKAVVDKVGTLLLRYYEMVAGLDTVGFLCSNDDWGFNSQTFLKPEDMRTYIFPWHKKIVELAHRNGKPCILHSCGYFDEIIEDVIEDIRFDARHSYEDKICPVETAYERLVGRIAVLGGMDMDFVCRSTPQQVRSRCEAMLDRTKTRGGYALGTGNSVPEYVPFENYKAIIDTVR
jgi:uroporphyrinogen decarboxylase